MHLGYSWSGARYMDFLLSIHWLIENGNFNESMNDILFETADLTYEQGFDWETWFEYELPTKPVEPDNTTLYTHGVNNGQAFKSAAVIYRQITPMNDTLKILSKKRIENMDKYHGQATGMFACDEHLAGRNPSRGTELCTVVETMFSMQVCFCLTCLSFCLLC